MNKALTMLTTTGLCLSTLCFANETKEAEKDSAQTLMHCYRWNASSRMEEEKPIVPQEKSVQDNQPLEIVYLNNLSEDDLYMFLAGVAPEHIAICCEKDSSIPLKIGITGNVLSLNGGKKEDKPLIMAQTLYVRNVQGDFLFSNDLTSWQPAALFFNGQLSMGIEPDSNGNLQLEVCLDLNS